MSDTALARAHARQPTLVAALDIFIELLLVSLLAFCAFAYGAVDAWSEGIACSAAALLAGLVAARNALLHQRDRRWWIWLPVIAYLAISTLQLIPLPAAVWQTISPRTLELRKELLSDLPNAAEVLHRMPATLYPHATRHDLRLVLLAGSVLFVVTSLFRSPTRIRRLMVWLALLGGAMGTLALAQDLTKATGIYWHVAIGIAPHGGTFVNHNHFAQFMNLTLGCALGLLLSSLPKDPSASRQIAWWTIPILLIGAVAIPLSLSRGGLLSMIVGGLVLLTMLARRGSFWRIGAVILVLGILAFAGVLALGIDRLYESFRVAVTPEGYATRLQMDRDALRIWREFPALGVGLGAHEVVFPAYERQIAGNVATHVENEYIQTLEEMGLAGFTCVVLFIAIVIASWIRGVNARDPRAYGSALGLGYGLFAVMTHSLTDYGQHLPAVAGMSAVVSALLINLAYPPGEPATSTRSRAANWAFFAVVLAAGFWLVFASWAAYQGESDFDRARAIGDRLERQNWNATDAAYADLLSASSSAVANQPGNIVYRYWDGAYRWRALTRHRNADGNVELQGANLAAARALIADLNQSRRLAPTFGPIYWYVGQKERLFNDPHGDAHILTAARLAPNDATANLLAGRASAERGQWSDADRYFRRALAIDPGLLDEIIAQYINRGESDRVVALFADDWRRTLKVAEHLAAVPGQKELADRVKARGIAMLQQVADRPDADESVLLHLAVHYFGQSRPADAERYFARAIELDYGNIETHFLRARCLDQLGRPAEARNEALTVLRMKPAHQGAQEMVERLEGK